MDHAARQYPARFMLYVMPVRPEHHATLPAITHVDGTARVQTVFREHNPLYYGLIERFGQATGVPVVLNTSFNLRGEPIVTTPANAFSTFSRSEMDCLVLGNFLIKSRPDFQARLSILRVGEEMSEPIRVSTDPPVRRSLLRSALYILRLVAVNLLVFFVLAELVSNILVHRRTWPSSRPTYRVNYDQFWVDINPAFGTWHRPNGDFIHQGGCFSVEYFTNSYGARDVDAACTHRSRARWCWETPRSKDSAWLPTTG